MCVCVRAYGYALCVNTLHLDIIGIVASQLTGSNPIHVGGYRWFGNNRKAMHKRA